MDIPQTSTPMYKIGPVKKCVSKSTIKNEFHPTQHKGRRIPLHPTEKVEKELRKLTDEKQKKTNEMLRWTIYKSSSKKSKIRSIYKNST